MKSLSLARPLILMTVGLPGAGKTKFSTQFADMFASPLVSYDRIRHELFNEPTYSDDELSIIQRIADYQIGELIKTKKTIIVDGAANSRADRTILRQMATKSGYGTLLVWVQTDVATCEARSVMTRRSAKDDPYQSQMSQEAFQRLSARFNPPAIQEAHVVISGKHTFGAQARTVLRRLAPSDETARQPSAPKTSEQPQPRTPRQEPPAGPNRRSVTIN